jgi:hypothetical protein
MRIVTLLLFLASILVSRSSRADVRTYVLAIGNNQPLAGGSDEPLAYADDDAADFYSLTRDIATDARLLTVLDSPSQRRFPALSGTARPPTRTELRTAVAELRTRFEADRAAGHEPVLLFFFSGHGVSEAGQPPALALIDGPLTQAMLYDEILAALPARFVHLFVDACHAEAIVRPRDANAKTVDLTADDVRRLAARTTLDRFPHVGAIVAASSTAQAHEWDRYERGVFTHEIISGLRGGADVDRNGRIEYSELSAFLAAANREVQDPRARLDVIVRPPTLDRRATLFDLSRAPGTGRLVGGAAKIGAFVVEDMRGNRLTDVNAEPGHDVSIVLPADQTLFIRARRGEAVLRVPAGGRVALESLVFGEPSSRARGALDESLRRGLFASPYGPLYYRGFVDAHSDELVPVPEPPADPLRMTIPPPARPSRTAGWIVTSAGVGAGLAAGVFGVLALDARSDASGAPTERAAADAQSRLETHRGLALGLGAAALVGLGVGLWLLR